MFCYLCKMQHSGDTDGFKKQFKKITQHIGALDLIQLYRKKVKTPFVLRFSSFAAAISDYLIGIYEPANPNIQSHISDTTINFTEDSIDHAAIQNVGTNTHAQIDSHISATDNPHTVTKSQVGLGNVDNTADLDKPPSNPQIEAFVNRSGDSMTGDLEFTDIDGNRKGFITTDDNAGIALAGRDADGFNAEATLFGSTVFVAAEDIGMSFNQALPHGFLTLGEAVTIDGRTVYPLTSKVIERELNSQQFTDSNNYTLNGVSSTVIVNGVSNYNYYSGATFSYNFTALESSNKSTDIEYWITVDGVESNHLVSTISPQLQQLVHGEFSIDTLFPADGDVVELHVIALDVTQGRNTTIRGVESTSSMTIKQWGVGATSISDVESFISGGTISTEGFSQEFVVLLETQSTYTLAPLSTIQNKSITVNFKNVSGGDATVQCSGSDTIDGEVSKTLSNNDNMRFFLTETYFGIL